jgi:hypothetical protein
MGIDELRDLILKGCPHAPGCEPGCPLAGLRALDPQAAVDALLDTPSPRRADIEQVHLLCGRQRRLRAGIPPPPRGRLSNGPPPPAKDPQP